MTTCPSHPMEQYEKENSLLNSRLQRYYTKNSYWMALLENEGEREGEQMSIMFLYAAKSNKVCLGSLKGHIRNDVQSHPDPRGAP